MTTGVPSLEQLEDVRPGGIDAAHDLGDDLDAGIVPERGEVGREHAVPCCEPTLAGDVSYERTDDAQPVPGCAFDVVGVLDEQAIDSGADRPVAEKADAHLASGQPPPPPSPGA